MTSPLVGGLTGSAVIDTIARIISSGASRRSVARQLQSILGGNARYIELALKMTDPTVTHRGTRHSPRVRGRGVAARAVQRTEVLYRAAYVANAAQRMRTAEDTGEALHRERRYYLQHELARRRRQAVARTVDAAASIHGPVLGWWTHKDDRTTPECRAADGTNFVVGEMPVIGYPGGVHMYCRCWPGPPFVTDRTVNEATFGVVH